MMINGIDIEKEKSDRIEFITKIMPTKDFNKVLLFACEYGRMFQMAELMLLLGADVNYSPEHGCDTQPATSVLYSAITYNSLTIVNLLINKGANVNIKIRWNNTPLTAACMFGYFEIAKVLIKAGADVNYYDISRWCEYPNNFLSPLSAATYGDNYSSYGIEARVQNEITLGHKKIVKLLKKHGATLDLPK